MSWQRWALPLRIPVRAYSGSEAKLMNLEELDVVLGGRSILNPREYNSLALAHIGDAVFEVLCG